MAEINVHVSENTNIKQNKRQSNYRNEQDASNESLYEYQEKACMIMIMICIRLMQLRKLFIQMISILVQIHTQMQ